MSQDASEMGRKILGTLSRVKILRNIFQHIPLFPLLDKLPVLLSTILARILYGSLGFFQENRSGERLSPSHQDEIRQISFEKWRNAQRGEYQFWMQSLRAAHDDRNWFHAINFQGYTSISEVRFRKGIELGCGPFTNMRIIQRIANFDRIYLLDPLIQEYLHHPNCKYYDLKINKQTVTPISSSIEQFTTSETFDCVILINVLEHCFNADLVFSKILSILDTNGYFIFHDRFYDNSDEILIEDSLHPIKISSSTILSFLQSNFKMIYLKRIRVRGISATSSDQESIYFIGMKHR